MHTPKDTGMNEDLPNDARTPRHDDVLAWVSKELDGELDVRERVLLDDHLAACPSCSRIRAELRGVRGFARDTREGRVLPPVGLVDRIVTHVMAPERAATASDTAQAPILLMRRLRRSAALAAAALLVLGGIYVGRLPREAEASHDLTHSRPIERDLERALDRSQSGHERGPGFLDLLLPPPKAK